MVAPEISQNNCIDNIIGTEIEPLKCRSYENVTLVPTKCVLPWRDEAVFRGAFAKDRSFIPYAHYIQGNRFVSKQLSCPAKRNVTISKQEVIYGDVIFREYGHFLIETLSRLWYTKESSLPVVWINPNAYMLQWAKDIFNLLGIKNEHIALQKPTRFAKVFFPEQGMILGNYLSPQHALFLASFEAPTENGKYVYLSRRKFNYRGYFEELELESFLSTQGWTIICPEDLSLQQQLHAICSAEVCMFVEGSAQHSLLLCKNLKTRFIALPRMNTINYPLVANMTSDNYFNLQVERNFITRGAHVSADAFTYDFKFLKKIIVQTKNFTEINGYENALEKPQKLSKHHVTFPSYLYKNIENTIQKCDKVFYRAVSLVKENKISSARKLFQYLIDADLVQPYMFVECHEHHNHLIEMLKVAQKEKEAMLNAVKKNTNSLKDRIQSYLHKCAAKTYLEIGVCTGKIFNSLNVSYKIAVAPKVLFDIAYFTNENTTFYSNSSDDFFKIFKDDSKKLIDKYDNKDFKFDVIFLNDLHRFEQALSDFENTLEYAHDQTIWIFNNTVPSSCFSAMTCQDKTKKYRENLGISNDNAWHGDIFKAIFVIHDTYPEFSYCTQISKDGAQTILWKTKNPTQRKKVFESVTPIAHMCYEDFLEYAWVLYPTREGSILDKLYLNIQPLEYKTGAEYELVCQTTVTDREKKLIQENKDLAKNLLNAINLLQSKVSSEGESCLEAKNNQSVVDELQKKLNTANKQIAVLEKTVTSMSNRLFTLTKT